MALDQTNTAILLELAWQVINHGVKDDARWPVEASQYSAPLRAPGAAFVTLTQQGQLRGCCGSVEAHQSLIEDVADNAFRTAFGDPRFEPLVAAELAGLRLEISVLSPLQAIAAKDQNQLLAALEPGRHGLVIRSGAARATFLPKVWEFLPEAHTFLQQLRIKAGIPVDEWPPNMRAFVYTTQQFGAPHA